MRYELVDNAEVVGIADYTPDGNVLVFPHTEIAASRRGNGLGDRLIRGALDDVRQRFPDAKVRPLCWFVDDFLRNNADYADLRAS
jgi:predicted GNAT family acetyltransferase